MAGINIIDLKNRIVEMIKNSVELALMDRGLYLVIPGISYYTSIRTNKQVENLIKKVNTKNLMWIWKLKIKKDLKDYQVNVMSPKKENGTWYTEVKFYKSGKVIDTFRINLLQKNVLFPNFGFAYLYIHLPSEYVITYMKKILSIDLLERDLFRKDQIAKDHILIPYLRRLRLINKKHN
jgi:hypothetical protein